MTITFPRTIPDAIKFNSQPFMLTPQVAVTPTRAARQYAQEIGEEFWTTELSTVVMDEADLGVARAFFDTLSYTREFMMYDWIREYPLAYAEGWPEFDESPPFDGTCILANVQSGNVKADLSGLPVGFILSPGDYIAFDYGSADEFRALHRVSAGGTADGSGEVTIEVRPNIRPGWEDNNSPPARTVYLHKPSAKMIIVPGSTSESVDVGRLGRWSFRAVQTL